MADVQAKLDDLVANGIPRTVAKLTATEAGVKLLVAEYRELEAIVRDLAAGDPVANTGGQEWDDYVCMLCPDDEVYGAHEQVVHHEDCPYGQAKLWVSAHPVSGDQR